jgi:hypothetical protein
MCLTASTHANKHAHISTLFCCSDCAVAAASYPDYCCMHRVCAASRGRSGYRPARSFRPTEHIQPGTLMSDSILVTYWATCFGHIQLAICWLLCCNCCTGFVQHAHTARYRLQGMSDCVNTREQAGIRALPCCAKAARQTSQLQLFALFSTCRMHRVCATCQYSQLQAALYARSNT